MPLSVSHVWAKLKKPIEVFRGGGGDFGLGDVQQPGQGAGRLDDKSGFVSLAALRRIARAVKVRVAELVKDI
jgi:hypothetical protein